MLRKEVIDAVKQKKYHVYRVSTVEEGIEILTGVRAGRPDAEGLYAPGTVFGEVQKKLKVYIDRARQAKQGFGWDTQ
jgi:hypothetical protein